MFRPELSPEIIVRRKCGHAGNSFGPIAGDTFPTAATINCKAFGTCELFGSERSGIAETLNAFRRWSIALWGLAQSLSIETKW